LTGNHAFKFGFEMVRVKFENLSTQNTFGTIEFNTLLNFMRGQPFAPGSSIVAGNPYENYRMNWYAGFIQDTWRITPQLTITPGLRYEYQGPPHYVGNPFLGQFDPNMPGGVVQVGEGGQWSKLYNPEKADFSPRFGAAWDIRGNGRTVLRGGVSRMTSFPAITAVALESVFGATLFDAAGNIVVDRRGTAAANFFAYTLTNPNMNWSQAGPVFPISGSFPACGNGIVIPPGFTAPPPVCATGGIDPNFKRPKTIQWSVSLQRAITNRVSVDIAYAGNHGYDETYSQNVNTVPVGTGYTPARIASCLAVNPRTASAAVVRTACAVDQSAITSARPYATAFPYLSYINRTTAGFWSNYNALQVTVDQRDFHGLSFLASYSYAHALDMWTKSSANTQQVADPINHLNAPYGASDQDIRHRFRFSPSYDIPGVSSPGQMLEGWRISAVLSSQGRFPWSSVDKINTDWLGTGENANTFSPSPNDGVLAFWNYSGPVDAFNTSKNSLRVNEVARIPCYGNIGNATNCTRFNVAPAGIVSLCENAAQRPYQGNAQLMALALRALYANGCYVQNGGISTPPAFGTNGNSGRNSFRGPQFHNVDLTISKTWTMGERYSAELRTEFYNLFNSPHLGIPSVNGVSPSAANFGRVNTMAAGTNPFTSGAPRSMQFGLKLNF
jgi:hypothetical protein